MLTRSSQVGEFYVMMPPQVKPTGEPSEGATLHTADLMIYDEESDKHVRITWWDALKATMAEALKSDTAATVSKGHNGSMNLSTWYTEAEQIARYSSGVESDGKTPATIPEWKNLDLDIRIVVARPFIEHLMHNAILAVSGRETGATLFGPADMQLSANTQVKTIEGHYTGHFKAVVTKPQNVLVMRDVACAGYVAGANCRWFAQDENGNFSAKACNENLMSRLAFDDDVTDKYASMLAFPAHEGQFKGGQLDTCMSVTTRLLPWDVSNTSTHDSFPGGSTMFSVYNGKLNLQQIHYGEVRTTAAPPAPDPPTDSPPVLIPFPLRCLQDMKAAENQEFISQVRSSPRPRPRSTHRLAARSHSSPSPMFAGLNQQQHVLSWSLPQVRPVYEELHVSHAGPGPLRAGRHSGRRALAPRGERVAQGGARFDDVFGDCAACPNGLHAALLERAPVRVRQKIDAAVSHQVFEHAAVRACVCVCICARARVGGKGGSIEALWQPLLSECLTITTTTPTAGAPYNGPHCQT